MTRTVRAQVRISHGIVFLQDPESKADCPDDTGRGPVLETDECVSLWVLHGIDGTTEFTMSDDPAIAEGLQLRLAKTFRLLSGSLSISEPDLTDIVCLYGLANPCRVLIYTDHEKWAARIACVVSAATDQP